MPIYIEDRENPDQIHFEEKSLGWVYFEQDLVWQNWHIIAEFDCNPTGGDFGISWASISSTSGNYKWEVNGVETEGEYVELSVDTVEKHVKLWGRGNCKLLTFEIYGTDIIGMLDLSNSAFRYCVSFLISCNPLMDDLKFPEFFINAVNDIQIENAGIESLDISMITSWDIYAEGGSSYLQVENCLSLAVIYFPQEFSGNINSISISNTAISGIVDISVFGGFEGVTGGIVISNNPEITEIILPEISAGENNGVDVLSIINNQKLQGVIDATGIQFLPDPGTGALGTIEIYDNPKVTGVLFAENITRPIHTLQITNNDISGTLDLSMFTTINGQILLYGNIHMTGVDFGSATGNLYSLKIYGCDISGTIDLNGFTWYTNSTIYIYGMASLTDVVFKYCNGGIDDVLIYGNSSLNYINIADLYNSMITGNNLMLDLKSNSWSAAIINQILYELDTVNHAPFYPSPPFAKVIDVSGTNAAPDSSSGGYDGTAAKASLQSKGFTVNTN
jgi:hypothetical protein